MHAQTSKQASPQPIVIQQIMSCHTKKTRMHALTSKQTNKSLTNRYSTNNILSHENAQTDIEIHIPQNITCKSCNEYAQESSHWIEKLWQGNSRMLI